MKFPFSLKNHDNDHKLLVLDGFVHSISFTFTQIYISYETEMKKLQREIKRSYEFGVVGDNFRRLAYDCDSRGRVLNS